MVARLCLPMSCARLDSNWTTKPKYGVALVCVQFDAAMP
jgi:hypothetical protein